MKKEISCGVSCDDDGNKSYAISADALESMLAVVCEASFREEEKC